MRVLVLGADGMLGHQVVASFVSAGHQVVAATRRVPDASVQLAFNGARSISGVDARIHDTLVNAFVEAQPDVVINAIGIVKQRPAAKDALESIRINGLFPHELYAQCRTNGSRLLHVSTDCVFSGLKGRYTEDDPPDPLDLYGRTKLIGEVGDPGATTLRTSIIGLELFQKSGLVEWFLRQRGEVPGWSRAMYSGVTTVELSRLIVCMSEQRSNLDGVWHVSSEPISKLDLLRRLSIELGRELELVPDDSVSIDRTMDSSRFRAALDYVPPSWDDMLKELANQIRAREGRISA